MTTPAEEGYAVLRSCVERDVACKLAPLVLLVYQVGASYLVGAYLVQQYQVLRIKDEISAVLLLAPTRRIDYEPE